MGHTNVNIHKADGSVWICGDNKVTVTHWLMLTVIRRLLLKILLQHGLWVDSLANWISPCIQSIGVGLPVQGLSNNQHTSRIVQTKQTILWSKRSTSNLPTSDGSVVARKSPDISNTLSSQRNQKKGTSGLWKGNK